jgi:hypothetical protein
VHSPEGVQSALYEDPIRLVLRVRKDNGPVEDESHVAVL